VCNDTPDGGFRETSSRAPNSCGVGLRGDPATPRTKGANHDSTRAAQYYLQKKDKYYILEPGFTLGGPILKNRLWFFTSYIPTLDRMSRTVNFTGPNPGLRTFLPQQYNSERAHAAGLSALHPAAAICGMAVRLFEDCRTTSEFPPIR